MGCEVGKRPRRWHFLLAAEDEKEKARKGRHNGTKWCLPHMHVARAHTLTDLHFCTKKKKKSNSVATLTRQENTGFSNQVVM